MLTLELAQRFRPRSLLGLDIDKGLVKSAVGALVRRRQALGEAYREAGRQFDRSAPQSGTGAEQAADQGPAPRRGVGEAGAGTSDGASGRGTGRARALRMRRKDLKLELQALRGVRFEAANFLEWGQGRVGDFHVVTCLSVVKWVHLNWGDAGLLAFLAKAAGLLAPGGRLVVEPQPWTSYAAAFRKQDLASCEGVHLLPSLELRPGDIGPELERLGLTRLPEECAPAPTAPGTPENFRRPLLVYQKPMSTPGAALDN